MSEKFPKDTKIKKKKKERERELKFGVAGTPSRVATYPIFVFTWSGESEAFTRIPRVVGITNTFAAITSPTIWTCLIEKREQDSKIQSIQNLFYTDYQLL